MDECYWAPRSQVIDFTVNSSDKSPLWTVKYLFLKRSNLGNETLVFFLLKRRKAINGSSGNEDSSCKSSTLLHYDILTWRIFHLSKVWMQSLDLGFHCLNHFQPQWVMLVKVPQFVIAALNVKYSNFFFFIYIFLCLLWLYWHNSWRYDRKQGEREGEWHGGVTCCRASVHGTRALLTELNSAPSTVI